MILETAQKISPQKEADEIWISEKKVMGRLGLTRDDIRSIRQEVLAEGQDWRTGRDRLIELSAPGIAKIEKHIGILTAVLIAQEKARKNGQDTSEPGSGSSIPPAPASASAASNAALTPTPFVDPARLIAWPALKTPQRLKVVWARAANRRALMCVHEGAPEARVNWLTVQVRDNANFLPGMTILALHDSGTLWQFAGNPTAPAGSAPRMPRNRGKW